MEPRNYISLVGRKLWGSLQEEILSCTYQQLTVRFRLPTQLCDAAAGLSVAVLASTSPGKMWLPLILPSFDRPLNVRPTARKMKIEITFRWPGSGLV